MILYISAAVAVYREFQNLININHLFFYGFWAPEAFKNDLQPRGVIFPKYRPVASHPDPIQPRNYKKSDPPYFPNNISPIYLHNFQISPPISPSTVFPIYWTPLGLCAPAYYIESLPALF